MGVVVCAWKRAYVRVCMGACVRECVRVKLYFKEI